MPVFVIIVFPLLFLRLWSPLGIGCYGVLWEGWREFDKDFWYISIASQTLKGFSIAYALFIYCLYFGHIHTFLTSQEFFPYWVWSQQLSRPKDLLQPIYLRGLCSFFFVKTMIVHNKNKNNLDVSLHDKPYPFLTMVVLPSLVYCPLVIVWRVG
jgi:hypothetical protein